MLCPLRPKISETENLITPVSLCSAAGGRHDVHRSVRDAASRKCQLVTVSLVFLTFAVNQISEHTYLNNETQQDVYKLF